MNQAEYDRLDVAESGKKRVGVDAATTLTGFETLVIFGASKGSYTVTLPHPGTCPQTMMELHLRENGTGTPTVVTVTAPTGTIAANLTIDADGDYAIIWSNGETWRVLVNGIA